MIDFIKIYVLGLEVDCLLNNVLLDFCDVMNPDTGELRSRNRKGEEITPKKTASYKGLLFTIYYNGRVTIQGSLHKYFNDGLHNHNDFDLIGVRRVLRDFKELFDISPSDCIITQLELGVNVMPPIPTNEMLKYSFMHKTTQFVYVRCSEEGRYIQAEHLSYIVKMYNKSLQYGVKGWLLRFEKKYLRSESLRKRGVKTLQDLVDYGLNNFKSELLGLIDDILFYDTTITHPSKSLLNYCNPVYWLNMIDDKRTSAFNKHKVILKDIIESHSQNVKKQFKEVVANKIDELTLEGARNEPLSISTKHTPFRTCPITGLSIEMQKEESRLLSHSGLRFLYENDAIKFFELKSVLLSGRWNTAPNEIQLKEMAHQIRNKYYNNKHRNNPNQQRLFN